MLHLRKSTEKLADGKLLSTKVPKQPPVWEASHKLIVGSCVQYCCLAVLFLKSPLHTLEDVHLITECF